MVGWAARIQKLIDRIGRDLTHRTFTKSGPSYNPVLVAVNTTVRGAVFDFAADEIDGTIIQQHDKQIWVAAVLFTISRADKIVDGTTEYSIVSLEEVKPGDATLLYMIHARA